jgi:hypothetical protein
MTIIDYTPMPDNFGSNTRASAVTVDDETIQSLMDEFSLSYADVMTVLKNAVDNAVWNFIEHKGGE